MFEDGTKIKYLQFITVADTPFSGKVPVANHLARLLHSRGFRIALPKLMDTISPLFVCFQAMRPILWAIFVMVLAGGNLVRIPVVMLSLFPLLSLSVATACDNLDSRLFFLAKVYKVRKISILCHVVLVVSFLHFFTGHSFVLGTSLQVAADAGFLGQTRELVPGYWAYCLMDMEVLFSWVLVIVGLGLVIDFNLIQPLRGFVMEMEGEHVNA